MFLFPGVPAAQQAPESTSHSQNLASFEQALINRYEWGQEQPRTWSIPERLQAHNVPGVALAIIEKNQVVYAKGYGERSALSVSSVDQNTLFSVGSVSKVANATLLLKLVDEGTLKLDTDVNNYLSSWKVPDSRYTRKHPVTLRHILSHTAGFNVHGFPDFLPGETLPDTLDTLNGKAPAKHRAVRVRFTPGSTMDYSGGGITVSQLVASTITKTNYVSLAKDKLFLPLEMSRSTFENPLPESISNVAFAHNDNGKPVALPRGYEAMPEMAASGLWTSASDLAKLVIAINNSYQSKNGFLSQALTKDMLSREQNSWYGLGPRINGEGDSFVFHHGGANNSYRAWIEGHPETGNGVVILTNGSNGHFVHQEIRNAIAQTRKWPVPSDGGFEEPELKN
ncbi:hypothetical protein MACH26_16500 [Planctobacterium marinum]|uniref:Beta-lactamase-related domain-containing protein n=2 Tax=Planctobacterium marinum TaxID=1631968 RepID=A0AA48HIY1_9ALTE|nr:hypothetical protein MACH26_16500 [Planctobacterium marinum]